MSLNPFQDIERRPLPQAQGIAGLDYLERVAGMQIGQGSKVFRGDRSGIWLGASRFADAPFSVDMDGNATLNSVSVGNYLTKTGSNQAVSGQVVVGGSVNGKLIVKNSSNVEKVTLDQDGITVNDGKITVKDSSSSTIIDATGLVSTVNFPSDGVFDTTAYFINSTSLVDVTGMSLSFTLARTAKVLITFSTVLTYTSGSSGTTYGGDVLVRIDSSDQDPRGTSLLQFGSDPGVVSQQTVSVSRIFSITSGSHTIKLRAKAYSAGGIYVSYTTFNYVILGS